MCKPVSMTVVPPSPVTTCVAVDIRAGLRNAQDHPVQGLVEFYLDRCEPENRLFAETITVEASGLAGVNFRWDTSGYAGDHTLVLRCELGGETFLKSTAFTVIESGVRSTARIDGAWCSLTHWSPVESRLWLEDLHKMTSEQWREQVRAMHEIGMDLIVIQELFRNEAYVGQHDIPETGFPGEALYPSAIHPKRFDLGAQEALEAILDEADQLGMAVFPGIGLYAWFDFTPGSLQWHLDVIAELWEMYGHHSSFYGWYISEEVHGVLNSSMVNNRYTPEEYQHDIIHFFSEVKKFCRALTPDKPVMLAPNCHGVPPVADVWRKLLPHIDILCPFGFHRMPEGDISGAEAAALLQELCDEAGTHLWLDMEVFLFAEDGALYPRPVAEIMDDLHRFSGFEKILCYQFPGLMNAPWATIQPGGQATVRLFEEYKQQVINAPETKHED